MGAPCVAPVPIIYTVRREDLINAEPQKAVDPTEASKRAICIGEATEYHEVAGRSLSSGYAHLETEEVANLKIPTLSGRDICCSVRPHLRTPLLPWLPRVGLTPEAPGVTVNGGRTPLTPGSLSSCHHISARMSGFSW